MTTPRLRRGVIAFAVAAALVGAATGISTPAFAATVSTTVDGVTYVADDAVAAGATATSYVPGPTDVVIPPTVTIGATSYAVTAIGPSAFLNSAITSVVIPDAVITIGDQAFRGAGSLVTVDLGEGVQTIGEYAFTNDDRVLAIAIPDSVTSIGQWAFDSMDLRSLTIGSGLTTIGVQVFSNNNRLESVVIPPNVTSIGFAAFAADDLRTLVIGSGVTTIGVSAFAYNDRLSSVTIPASVTAIGNAAFQNNSGGGSSLTATFEGAAPATFGTNVFAVANPTVVYRWRFGAPQSAGGYTSPTWRGYASRAIATVTFDTAGHGADPADRDVVVGSATAAPPAPADPGFTFTGWTVVPGGGTYDFATLVTGDLALDAQWAVAAPVAVGGAALAPTGRPTGDGLVLGLLLLLAGVGCVAATAVPRRAR